MKISRSQRDEVRGGIGEERRGFRRPLCRDNLQTKKEKKRAG